jgi:stress-induced morphogen
MSLSLRGKADTALEAVIAVLAKYEAEHRSAEIEVFRQNSVSIRIRIVDPDFADFSRTERHNSLWKLLGELSQDVQSEISTILLLTPEEKKNSFASFEFDDPLPSRL